MRNFYLLLSILLLNVFYSISQNMVVSSTPTATQLVNSLVGPGITVSNITTNNAGATQRGSFTGGSSISFPIDQGLILTSGSINEIPGFNTSGTTSTNANGGSDADLNNIASGGITDDCSIIEFDFIPTSDTFSFKYIFSSEEYPEFVCGSFNDRFAFFLTGPNPSGGNYTKQNLAVIPGTNTYVGVNTINTGVAGSQGASANCAVFDPNWANYNTFYNDNPKNSNLIKIKCDGYTSLLGAGAKVVCGQTYHIKMAIGDGGSAPFGDTGYDSYVFLQAGSFISPGITTNSQITDGSGAVLANSYITENCSKAVLTFTANPVPTSNYTVNYTLGGTAINNSDYTASGKLTILAGQATGQVQIIPTVDNVIEADETVIITTSGACGGVGATTTITIKDELKISGVKTSDPTCSVAKTVNSDGVITLTASGGATPYTYSLDNGVTYPFNSSPISTLGNGTYNIKVKDKDGCIASDLTAITMNKSCSCVAPVITSSKANPSTCNGTDGKITLSGLTNGKTYALSYVKDGAVTATTSNFTASGTTYDIITLGKGVYTAINVTESGCTSNDETQTLADPAAITITSAKTNPTTCGGTDGKITLSGLTNGKTYALSYVKDGAVPTTSNFTATGTTYDIATLGKGVYTLINVTESGCTSNNETQTLADPGGITITSAKTNPTTCGGTDGKITLSGLTNGLTYALSYVKDGAVPTTSNFTATGTTYDIATLGKGVYTLINVTESGCTSNNETQTLADPGGITITSAKTNPTTCGGTDGKITLSGLTNGLTYALSYVKDGAAPTTSSFLAAGSTYDIPTLGKGVYTLINVTESGCTSNNETQTLADPGGITITSAKTNPTTCGGTDGKITLSGLTNGKTYALSYVKDGAAPTTSSFLAAGSTYDIPTLGKGVYTLINVTESGCTSNNETQTLTEPSSIAKPTATLTHPTCLVTTGTITIATPTGNYTYSKDGVAFQASPIFPGLTANSNYTITVKDGTSNCLSDSTFKIDSTLMIPIPATASIQHATCLSATGGITVTAPLGAFFTYAIDGATFKSGTNFTNLATGNYTITTKTTSGCTSTSAVVINVPPAPPVNPTLFVKQPDCTTPTGTITILTPKGTNFTYSLDSVTFQSLLDFPGQTTGDYTVFVKDTTNCVSKNTTKVNPQPETPVASFSYDPSASEITIMNPQVTFINKSINATSYKWGFDDGSKISTQANPYHEFPSEANVYFVKLTASNLSCSDDTTIAITIIEKPIIYIPNTFTPNGDEANNTFVPVIGGGISSENYSLYIYSRWGELMFESHNKEVGWDGTYGNKTCEPGTYIWKLEYRESTGSKTRRQQVGHINLIF